MLEHLSGRTGILEAPTEIEGRTYHVAHPKAADTLIDEEDFARDERLPYWAELWPSAVALARLVAKEDLAGRRVVELGCGVGLPSIVALSCGAEVLATDYYAEALDFAHYNAWLNLGREMQTHLLDWHEPETRGLEECFDVVLAADVLYESRNVLSLATLIPILLAPEGEVLLADPRRKDTLAFLQRMRSGGFRVATEEGVGPSSRAGILVHRLRRRH